MRYGPTIGLFIVMFIVMLIAAGLTQGYHLLARGVVEIIVFVVYLKTFIVGK